MAEIRPFRAWRYAAEHHSELESLVSPPFDVISERQRKALYQNPRSSAYMTSPVGEDPAEQARHTLEGWKRDGVIVQDEKPSVYVYYQRFKFHNDPKPYVRKGFVAFIRVYEWEENVLLRHENTIAKAVDSSARFLERTELNASPTHGLYTDPDFELEPYMDAAIASPLYETEDYQGVRDALGVIDDPQTVARFVEKLKGKPVILADGHHRYESSIAHLRRHGDRPGAKYHMMWFTNTEADDLRVLPTHRLVQCPSDFDPAAVMARAAESFEVKPVAEPFDLEDMIAGKPWTFGVAFKDASYMIRLRPEAFDRLDWNFPEEIKEVDLTVLHYFFIEKALGIPGKQQRHSDCLRFERNFAECLTEVFSGKAQAALIVNEVPVETIKRVCYSGYTMPMKSTFFYPKAVAGFLFGSIKAEEL